MTGEAGPQSEALAAALKDLTISKRDGAAVQLAKRYAELLDEPGVPAKYRDQLRQISAAISYADNNGFDTERAELAMEKIVSALSEQTVASDLGPKYLAALTSLGMTPAGRGVRVPAAEGQEKPKGPTDELRQRRDDRERRRLADQG